MEKVKPYIKLFDVFGEYQKISLKYDNMSGEVFIPYWQFPFIAQMDNGEIYGRQFDGKLFKGSNTVGIYPEYTTEEECLADYKEASEVLGKCHHTSENISTYLRAVYLLHFTSLMLGKTSHFYIYRNVYIEGILYHERERVYVGHSDIDLYKGKRGRSARFFRLEMLEDRLICRQENELKISL